MKHSGIALAVLLVLQGVWLGASQSQNPASNSHKEEVSKQEAIYHSHGKDTPTGYTVDRSLADYAGALPRDFGARLASLGPTDRWLDIGAGEGMAILDYYTPQYDVAHPEGRERRGKKARAVAISIEDRRTPRWRSEAASLESNQVQYLVNKRLREYSREELGKFQVITDVVGGFSYSENLSLFMEKVLSFLEVNGSFYTVLQDVHSEQGTNKPFYAGSPYLTEIENVDGSEVKVCSWLKSITCAKVTCEFRTGWKPPIEAFAVHKICDDVRVPPLANTHYAAGTPPERRYRLGNLLDE